MLSCGWLYLGKHFIIINQKKKKEKRKGKQFFVVVEELFSWSFHILIQMYPTVLSVIDAVNHLLPKITSLV